MWNPIGKPISEYFTLGDLWDCFEKYSACGCGTKVVLNNGEDVVQYFVPYLSAIQIFTGKSPESIRCLREDFDGDELDSEFCSDENESDKFSRSVSNNSSKGWDASSGDSNIDHEDLLPMRDSLTNLYFKFHDSCPPYWRIPIFDKISELAEEHPGLMTLKSTDLSPASWMAISWYPIYHIPVKGTVEDLSAAFLTFHTLSSFFQDDVVDVTDEDNGISNVQSCEMDSPTISLPPFGLASYKLIGDIWFNHGELDYARLFDLQRAADSWLKQLDFEHHDFKFFTMKIDHVYFD